jgi:class 3 adenylate cyclase
MDLSSILERPPQILVADDDTLNRDLLRTYLMGAGCKVVTASTGQQALELVRQSAPDLMLLDVQMPGPDGIELCKRFKADARTQFIPIVIVTAFDRDEERLRAIDAGADDFVGKPFNPLILLARVRSLLRLKALHSRLEERNRLLRKVLDRYVAEDLADLILTDPEHQLRLGGESRQVTVLFADIRGFTRFTESHPADVVIETLNNIFRPLSQLVYAYRGTFDKFLGDGLMAFYGAPVSEQDDAQRAVDTAIAMQRLFALQMQDGGPEVRQLSLGIGLHSGEAVVGNIGSESVMDYTVVGDVVNVAKRLQEAAQGGEILISEQTYLLLQQVAADRLPPVHLPGRTGPIVAYRVRLESEN